MMNPFAALQSTGRNAGSNRIIRPPWRLVFSLAACLVLTAGSKAAVVARATGARAG
jgi:hypothetical protein